MTSGMCASYTETYQSYEVVTPGSITYAFEPTTYRSKSVATEVFTITTDTAPYVSVTETGKYASLLRISVYACTKGYTCDVGIGSRNAQNVTVSRCDNKCPYFTVPSNWYIPGGGTRSYAPCTSTDTTYPYTAPCGRSNTKTEDVYGYITRTRTTTHSVQAGCLSSTLYSQSDASISTRKRNSTSRSYADYHYWPASGTELYIFCGCNYTENIFSGIFCIGIAVAPDEATKGTQAGHAYNYVNDSRRQNASCYRLTYFICWQQEVSST